MILWLMPRLINVDQGRGTTHVTDVFYRAATFQYPCAVRSAGCEIFDSEGRSYIDGSGGAAVSMIGHGNKRVVEAIKRQAEAMVYAHTTFFTNEPQEALAAKLAGRFHEPGARVFFTSGGSEATETALKIARQYHVARGNTEKHIVIGRRGSYHGATLGALSVSGTRRRTPFEPMLYDWPRISPCYAYRDQATGETREAYAKRVADELETAILRQGPSRISAFIAEPVVGSTLGAVPAEPGYLARIREICDTYDILFICDEIMCGAGRTGTYFACETDNARPDMILAGKGLAAGYQPLGAVIASKRVHDAIAAGPSFEHGFTYVGHPIACAAALAVAEEIEAENLLPKALAISFYFMEKLKARFGNHPHVGDIRGRGLMVGVEFVLDRMTKAPIPNSSKVPTRLKLAAMARGLICYPDGGNVNGNGAHVLLAPPMIITRNQCDQIVDRLAQAIDDIKIGA